LRPPLWLSLICAGILILGGGLLFSCKMVILRLENLDHPCRVRIPVDRSGRFFLSYSHSIYDAPVTEEFEILGGKILLLGVRTKSPAVMEYYGFDTVSEFHHVHRAIGRIRLRVEMGEAQRLSCGGREISLAALGASGDLVEISPEHSSLGLLLIEGLWGKEGGH